MDSIGDRVCDLVFRLRCDVAMDTVEISGRNVAKECQMRLMQFTVMVIGLMLVSRVSAEDRIAKWLRAIDDGDAETRIEAIDRLAAQDWSPNSAQAAVIRPRLEPLLQDADLKIRGAAAYAYLAVSGQPELVESLLSQPDLGVAVSAAKALLAYTDRVEQPVAILAEAYARVNFDLAGSFLHMSPALARRVAHELLSLAEKDHDDLEQDQLPIRRQPTTRRTRLPAVPHRAAQR